MPLRTEAYYRGVAADALARIGVEEPPVPLDSVAVSLGIPVRYVSLPSFFAGVTVYEDGLPVMVLNWARSETERAGTLAHMLGHVLLVLAGDDNAFPRESTDHTEADLVARELVLPTRMVIDQGRLWFNDYRYLARLFAVEEDVMLARMRDIGLVKGPEGMDWNF